MSQSWSSERAHECLVRLQDARYLGCALGYLVHLLPDDTLQSCCHALCGYPAGLWPSCCHVCCTFSRSSGSIGQLAGPQHNEVQQQNSGEYLLPLASSASGCLRR